jgi:anti-sigma-K factor RskA
MTPQEYISSGILETYALGAATSAERQDVETMVSKYPEVKIALDEICADLETYATMHSVEPDEKLRAQILAKISGAKASAKNPENGISKSAKVIPLQPASSRFKILAIAASVVLLVSVGINIMLWNNQQQNSKTIDNLLADKITSDYKLSNDSLEISVIYSQRDSILRDLNFLRHPPVQNIALNGNLDGHSMSAVVHWDMSTMKVMVDPYQIPATKKDEVYVLWAIVDGKPVNEGDFTVDNSGNMMNLDTVPKADAFAISLEKSGDVSTPAGPIYVTGKPAPSQP